MITKPGKFLCLCAIMLIAAASCPAQSVKTHHVRDVVRNGTAQANGRLPNNQVLQLDLVLPLRDPAGLKAFLADVYNPSSPNYRQFLTPAQFTARFGPTVDQYDAVLRFAKTYGFQVLGGSRDGMEVQVKGTVADIEAAFHANMRVYKHPTESRDFYSPDSEPTLDLPFSLWHFSGLEIYSIPKPLHICRDEYASAHGLDAQMFVSHATTGSGPSASFLGSDMRAAYYGSGPLTGAGQNLGLLEYYGTNLTDLTTYFTNAHQTNNVPVTLLSTDGTSTSCSYPRCDDGEQNPRHDSGARHGARAGQSGDVHRIYRHGHHQRHDHSQPAPDNHRLLVGMDACRSQHPRYLFPEDGRAGAEFLCRLGRLFNLEVERQFGCMACRRRLHRFGRRYRSNHLQRCRPVGV